MKLLIGQLAVVLLVLLAGGLAYMNFRDEDYRRAIPLSIWTITVIAFGFWTRFNPSTAFKTLLAFYLLTVIIKDAFVGGEYLLTVLFHLYFIISMIVGMLGTIEEFKKLSGD